MFKVTQINLLINNFCLLEGLFKNYYPNLPEVDAIKKAA